MGQSVFITASKKFSTPAVANVTPFMGKSVIHMSWKAWFQFTCATSDYSASQGLSQALSNKIKYRHTSLSTTARLCVASLILDLLKIQKAFVFVAFSFLNSLIRSVFSCFVKLLYSSWLLWTRSCNTALPQKAGPSGLWSSGTDKFLWAKGSSWMKVQNYYHSLSLVIFFSRMHSRH